MNLYLIECNDECRTCGAGVVGENIERKNGEEVHFREFSCGCKIKSSKIRMIPDIVTVCSKAEELRLKAVKRKIAKEMIKEFTDKLDVDATFKSNVSYALSCRDFD